MDKPKNLNAHEQELSEEGRELLEGSGYQAQGEKGRKIVTTLIA